MTWCGIEGHDSIVERFRRSLKRNRLASSYLFVGPSGIGKRAFAIRLAQAFLCERGREVELEPCLDCSSCRQVIANSHPDLEIVARPADKATIPLELFIGSREHRGQEGLCHWISLRPSRGHRRIAIIDDADWLSLEGANCLLKTLEEPPPGSLLLLIGTSQQRQLPTIRSRCQIIRFQPLASSFVRSHLLQQEEPLVDAARIDRIVELAEGSLDQARDFADPQLQEFDDQLALHWAQPTANTVEIAKSIQAFVDEAGSGAPARRQRLRQVILITLSRLRHQLRQTTQENHRASHSMHLGEQIVTQLEDSLEALLQIDANANLPTLIECWVDNLGQADYRRQRQRP